MIVEFPFAGAKNPSLDLLPSPTLPQSWTTHLPHDDGKEGDEVFSFDGEHHYAQIPKEVSGWNEVR